MSIESDAELADRGAVAAPRATHRFPAAPRQRRRRCGGRAIHEPPTVHDVARGGSSPPLTVGLVLAVEPVLTLGRDGLHRREDGWTIASCDGAPTSHWEHTIVVTRAAPIVLTAPLTARAA